MHTLRTNLIRVLGSSDLQLPANYLVLDLETTGLEAGSSYIWNIGLFSVLDGKPQHASNCGENLYLAYAPEIIATAIFEINRRRANILGISEANVDLETRVCDAAYYKVEQQFVNEVTAKGKDPKQILQYVFDVIELYTGNGWPLVGQNFTSFDLQHLAYTAARHGLKFNVPYERLIDTGLLIKSAFLGRNFACNENCQEFYTRIKEERAKGVFYGLEKFCIPHWRLDQKYFVDVNQIHGAGMDTWITSLVLKELINDVQQFERSQK